MTQEQVDLIVGAVEIVCLVVCFLKWKIWTVILVILGTVVIAVGPLITGNYITNVLSPFVTLAPIYGAIRLAKPVSWWAKWFYWGPMGSDRQLLRRRPSPKLARALARFPEQTVNPAAMTQDTSSPAILSHQDFVSEVRRTGLIPVTVETFVAYQFAASYSNSPLWYITGWMQMLFTSPAVSIAIVILAFVLRDWRILLAIPAAIYGPPGIYGLRSYRLPDFQKRWRRDDASPAERYMWRRKRGDRIAKRLHQLLDFVALAGLCYTWFTFGWRSPWFLICAAYLVTFLECVIYHALVWRALTRMLINDPDFYNAALASGVIRP